MRIAFFLLIINLFLSLYSCSEEQPYKPEKKAISLWPEQTAFVRTEVDLIHGNYTLQSDNPEIATVSIYEKENSLDISAHKSGTAMIRVIDTNKNKVLSEIHVGVKYFASPEIINWGIPLANNPNYPKISGIIIETEDIETQKKIEEELWSENKLSVGTIYTFNIKTNRFTVKTESGQLGEGMYEWNITTLTLTHDDGRVNKYGFSLATGMSYGYIIQDDKTKECQQKYPNIKITEVKVNHVWKDNGIMDTSEFIF